MKLIESLPLKDENENRFNDKCMNHGMLRIPIDFFIVKNVQKVLNILPKIPCDFDQKTLQDCVDNLHL
jgi:hypothetical protein